MTNKTLIEFICEGLQNGHLEISDSVFLDTKENMQENQKNWGESDKQKTTDFSKYPYWIIVSHGVIGCESLVDALDWCFGKSTS